MYLRMGKYWRLSLIVQSVFGGHAIGGFFVR
jgi:hypothetical protein